LWEELLEEQLSEFDSSFLSGEYQNVILFNGITSQEAYLRISRIGRGQPITRKQRIEVWKLIELYLEKKKADQFVDRAELFNMVTSFNNTLNDKRCNYVIADEIQDMSNVEIRFLRSLVEEKNNDLFLVGDPYQKIYARKINFTAAGVNVRGTKSRQLRINYRTSEEIKRLAVSAVKGISYDDFDGENEKLGGYLSLFHGSQPTYELFRTKDQEIEAIIKYIETLRKVGYNYRDIAIGCRIKEAIKEIKTNLHKLKIPYTDGSSLYSDSNQGVILSTFHSLKGLEFKAVILADVNNRTAPLYFKKFEELSDIEKDEYLQSERALLYVAMTRAVAVLKVTGTGVGSDLIRI
jgi:superfamily I DNA/RNA helicase